MRRRHYIGVPAIKGKIDIPATLCLIGATICWGVVPVMLRYLANPEMVPDGFTANFIRYPISALIYLPWLIVGIRSGKLGTFWLTALIPTAVNVTGQTLWACSPYYLEAGVFAFLIRLCTVWGLVGAFCLFPDERRLARSLLFWIGALTAFGGFTAMSFAGEGLEKPAQITGVIIILTCSVFWGMYGVTVRYTMKDLHPLVVFAVISTYTSLGLIPIGAFGDIGSLLRMDLHTWGVLIISSLLGIAMAHGLFYFAVQRIGVAISLFSLMLAPFISIVCSNITLNESFTTGQWIGGSILICGTTMALWSQQYLKPLDKAAAEVIEP